MCGYVFSVMIEDNAKPLTCEDIAEGIKTFIQ